MFINILNYCKKKSKAVFTTLLSINKRMII